MGRDETEGREIRRKENSEMRLKMIVVIIVTILAASLVRYFFGDICGFTVGLCVYASLERWGNS